VISGDSSATGISLGSLTAVSGGITISNDGATGSVDLGSLTDVGGSLNISNDGATGSVDLGSLTDVGGSLDISNDTAAQDVNVAALTSAGDVTVTNDSSATNVDVSSLTTAGDVTVTNDSSATNVDVSSLTTAGDVTVTNDTSATNVDLGSLTSAGGDVDVSNNDASTNVSLASLDTVGGSLTLDSAGPTLDVGNASVGGDSTLTGNGTDTVSAQTAGGTTTVNVLGGTAAMHAVLPDGAFDQPVAFTIDRQGDLPPEPGTTATGSPAQIDPLAGYQFSFAVPTLNQDAQLGFTIDLSTLDDATRTALLAGVQDGSATLAVKGDDPTAAYQGFAACAQGQTPETDGCVDIVLLGSDGQPVQNAADAAFVQFVGVAGHFSTYAVAFVTPAPLTIAAVKPSALGQGAVAKMTVTGMGFDPHAQLSLSGTGINLLGAKVKSATRIVATVGIALNASMGPSDVTVTNPGGGGATCSGCLTVDAGPKPASTSPSSGARGITMSVDVLGSNFQPGARVQLGRGITVDSLTFVDSTDLRLDITISSTAALGPRSVKVVNPDGGRGRCSACFQVVSS